MGVREWQRAEHWKSETGREKRRTLNRECGDRKESEREQENWGMGEKCEREEGNTENWRTECMEEESEREQGVWR